ncbi:MAG: cation:proton antiporter [Acetobacteraceae bacterium]|nr:cation:proton antiporter [Acetobacteraceae bacterium]
MLATLVALLGAATISVPFTRRLGFGSVLGYLLAGIAIGPAGLRLVTNVEQIAAISSLGVIMLLFLIGLELRPQRLWIMRRAVFGLGPAQVVVTGVVFAVLAHIAHLGWPAAVALGGGLALSSTAIVLPMLAERDLLASRAGRDGFAVLLFQDLAFIPMVAMIPALASGDVPDRVPWHDVARGAAAIGVILIGGRFMLRPLLRAVGSLRTPEVFTAMALLIVTGTAALCQAAGLSMSLGAFLAGVLLSGSEYRHELQADIEPFEGLLLGFFFISVGMSVDVQLAMEHLSALATGILVIVVAKAAIAFALGRIAGQSTKHAVRFALSLPQGSEFSFVLFGAAVGAGAMSPTVSQFATLLVAASMVATPILFAASEMLVVPRLQRRPEPPQYDKIEGAVAPVIICGFGRVGQIVGRVLRMRRIPFTALEKDSGQVEVVRRFGTPVYYGDPARPDLLRAAGAEQAKLVIVALDNMEETTRVVDMVRRDFPRLKILARARNRFHAHLLMDREVDGVVRDTFYSSLRLGEMAMTALGIPESEATRAVELFRVHDERNLVETQPIYRDEQKFRQSVQDAARELESLFEADQADGTERQAAE